MKRASVDGERRDKGRPRGAAVTEAVLVRTLEELATAGLEGLSVERVARAAAVNKTSVYRRWPTREALVAAALEGLAAGVAARLEDTGSLRGDLLALAQRVAGLLSQARGRAVVRAALAEGASEAVAALASKGLHAQARSPLQALAQRAKARGEWRADASVELLLAALVGALLHRAMLERAPLTKRWLAALVAQLVAGVTPPAPPRPRPARRRRLAAV